MPVHDVERVEWALRERVKELTCLYGIARVTQQANSLEEALQKTVELLPPAWQFCDIACARIVLDDREFATRNFRTPLYQQKEALLVNAAIRGSVELGYL